MAIYYCTDAQITDLLPSLTGSQIDTEAKRNAKLRATARSWVDSVYPGTAPFPGISAASEYLVNGEVDAGETAVSIDGGSGDPVAGEIFCMDGHNALYKVDAYSSPVLTFRWVQNFNPGVESDTASGAMADIKDNTPLHFGTPELIQEAARWYAVSVAYQILRDNPLDKNARAALARAEGLLQVKNGRAQASPLPWWADARDRVGERFSAAVVELIR